MNKPERDDLRRLCEARPLAINFDAIGSVLALLDALDEAEEALAEDEHWMRLALVDPGANPPVSWKDRCLEAERKLAEAETANKELIGEILQEDEFVKEVLP